MRASRARPVAAAVLVAALGAAGCGDAGTGEDDAVLTVYVSTPLSGPAQGDGEDVADGARLALADAGGRAGELEVRAEYLDASAGGGRFEAAAVAANARRAVEDSSSIAYIGELDSAATRTSLPITNEANLLQVAPGSTAPDLVRESSFDDAVPQEIQTTGERTFARVVPSDDVQGAAGAAFAKRLGATRVEVVRDGSAFGATLAESFTDVARQLGLDIVPASGERYLAGSDLRTLFMRASSGERPSQGQGGRLIVSDALLSPELRGAHATSATLAPAHLPPAGAEFVAAFQAEHGREPGRYAAYGYEAMAAVLAAVERAEDATDRQAAIDALFDGTERDSVIGTYSITDTGETTLDRLSGYELAGGAGDRLRPVAELRVR